MGVAPAAAAADVFGELERDGEGVGPVGHAVAAAARGDHQREIGAVIEAGERDAAAAGEAVDGNRLSRLVFRSGVGDGVAGDGAAPERLGAGDVERLGRRDAVEGLLVIGALRLGDVAARAAFGCRKAGRRTAR